MQSQKTPALKTVFSDVLADLAFMCADDQEAEPTNNEQWLATSIDYNGPMTGALRLVCTRAFAVQLAANLLGIDASDDSARQESDDAVRELTNILCGQFVTAVHGSEDVFNLTIPEVVELSETPDFEKPCAAPVEASLLFVNGQRLQLLHRPGERESQAQQSPTRGVNAC